MWWIELRVHPYLSHKNDRGLSPESIDHPHRSLLYPMLISSPLCTIWRPSQESQLGGKLRTWTLTDGSWSYLPINT
jgi:hypothetical protein